MPNNSSEGKSIMNYEDLEGEFLEYASIVKLTEGQEMTPAEISSAIAAIKNGFDLFKTLGDSKDVKALRIITAIERELLNLETELLSKDKEIFQLKEQLNKSQNKPALTQRGNYWYEGLDAISPVCSGCFDSKDKVVHLLATDYVTRQVKRHDYQCPTCQTTS